MRFLLALIAIHVAVMSFGQSVLSKIPASGTSMVSFIPKDYDTIMTVKGDLNNDKLDDIAMVLKSKIEDKENAKFSGEDIPQRLLVILFKSEKGYNLAAKSDSSIMCLTCGGVFGDPFTEIRIQKSVVIIDHYAGSAWRWATTHKFRYQQNDFYLIGITTLSYWSVQHCDKLDDFAGTDLMDINLITGSYVQKKISEECKLLVNKKGKKKVEPLQKLSATIIDN